MPEGEQNPHQPEDHIGPPQDPEADAIAQQDNGEGNDHLLERLRAEGTKDSEELWTIDRPRQYERALEVLQSTNVAEHILNEGTGNWASIEGTLKPYLDGLNRALNPNDNRSVQEQHQILLEQYPDMIEELRQWLPLLQKALNKLQNVLELTRILSVAPGANPELEEKMQTYFPQHVARGLFVAAATERYQELLDPVSAKLHDRDQSDQRWIKDVLTTDILDSTKIEESWHTLIAHLPWKQARARLPREYVSQVVQLARKYHREQDLLKAVIHHPELERFSDRVNEIPELERGTDDGRR